MLKKTCICSTTPDKEPGIANCSHISKGIIWKIILILCFLCSFSIWLSLKGLNPEPGKWKINLFSCSTACPAPYYLWCVWQRFLGPVRSRLCVSRGEHRVKSWRNGDCSESDEKFWSLGVGRVTGIVWFEGALRAPYRRVYCGDSEWSWIIWARVWPTCWERSHWSLCGEVGVPSPIWGWVWW